MDAAMILDLVIIAVLAVGLIFGAWRGLLASLAGLVIFVAALVGAAVIASALTAPVTEFVRPMMESRIEEKIDAAMVSQEEGTASPQAPVVEGIVPSVSGQAGDTGSMNNAGTPGDMSTDESEEDSSILQQAQEILAAMGYRKGVQESVSEKVQETVRDTSVSLVTALVGSLLETVVHTVLFLLSFAVLTLVLRLVVKMLDLMARLPGIHMLNSLGGAAVGLAESILILFLLFWVLDRFGVRIAQSTIDETYLLRFFVTEGPLGFLSVL